MISLVQRQLALIDDVLVDTRNPRPVDYAESRSYAQDYSRITFR